MHVVVLLPCFNEEATIGGVVHSFREHLPRADVYVYDNNSDDRTVEEARAAGAIVRREKRQGKGNVVRRMFADIDADVYVLADGDGTYDAASAPRLIERLVDENLDMVVATRLEETEGEAFRRGHRFGNVLFTNIVGWLFGDRLEDVLSGYRVFSRRFVKSFPGYASGFEIESELSVHALSLKLPFQEMPVPYGSRPPGSESKLSTYGDGLRILRMVLFFLRDVRPLLFFSTVAALLALLACVLMYPIILTYLETGLVPRFPTAILATGIMLLAFLSLGCGLILDSVASGRWEAKRRAYLSEPPAESVSSHANSSASASTSA